MSHQTPLLETRTLSVSDIQCHAPRGGCGPECGGEVAHLTLLRHGSFAYHLGQQRHVADPATALFHSARHSYRISHPIDGGDSCTVIACSADVAEEVFGADALDGRRHDFAVDAPTHLAHLAMWRALQSDTHESLTAEECALELVGWLRHLPRLRVRSGAPRRRLRRQVDDARCLLAERLDSNVAIDSLARTLGLSPFHLMRSFRAQTGLTLRTYRRRLRVAAAMAALARGHDDLTRLALDLGFASHSHMDAAFRRELGHTPTHARHRLARTGKSQWRRFVQAMQTPPG
ncbi:MAG TPA: AraC family transcriptional regulator [Oleiagrimonas sp.]|nr:AraC family transcriptional regulator [Oleiagrimonas sp.]